LPEGIFIIDDSDSQFKFINNKIKEVFNVTSFLDAQGNIQKLMEIDDEVQQYFEKAISEFSRNSLKKDSEGFLKCYFSKFNVVNNLNES